MRRCQQRARRQGEIREGLQLGRDAIADEDILRKFGALDGENIIAQAYYKVGDYSGCVRYVKSHLGGGGQNALELERRCAFENGDADTQRDALEQLVSSTGKPEYWGELLDAATKTYRRARK